MDRDKIHNLKSELVVEKPQFDRSLGGEEVISNGNVVNYRTFVEYRIREIEALTQAIEEPQRTTLIFQELPRHMRRRVMGHTTKRLPRMLREAHRNQLAKGIPSQQQQQEQAGKKKAPSRRHKRRPRKLLDEFNRRQRDFVWLETHMWHAKRFRMVDKWGYKLADRPNDKSYRACYRATAKHCLLQDVSFLCCVQLTGPMATLLEGLKRHTRAECGLTFAARVHLSGAREGTVTLFRRDTFPHGAIGNVAFLWRPTEGNAKPDDGTEVRSLWIWVHPASYSEVLEEFVGTFELKPKDEQEETLPPVGQSGKVRKNVEKKKLETRNVPFVRTPKYENDSGVEMVSLKDTLSRLRLTGPLSQAVLGEALCIPKGKKSRRTRMEVSGNGTKEDTVAVTKLTPASDIDDIFALMSKPVVQPSESSAAMSEESSAAVSEESTDEEMETDKSREHDWWTDIYKSKPFYKAALKAKSEFWQSVTEKQSPAELPPNLVIGITIVDPRLRMPLKRKKAVPDDRYLATQPRHPPVRTPPPSAPVSEIWEPAVRDVVTTTKRDVAELNAVRERNLVPGYNEDEEEEVSRSGQHSRIPVLLIQRPGCRRARDGGIGGLGSGWDVVAPAGWALPLWMGLVLRGARPGGLREAEGLAGETADVGALGVDTLPGRREAEVKREELTERYFGLPPAKRPNFLKLGVSSPFSCPWDVLASEWGGSEGYHVLRERRTLLALRAALRGEGGVEGAGGGGCLVPVVVTTVARGTPEDFSLVCAPTERDLELLSEDRSYPGPVEPQHADDCGGERRDLRAEHGATLKRLRRRRVRAAKSGGETEPKRPRHEGCVKPSNGSEGEPNEEADRYRAANRRLWLPDGLPVKDRCSRRTLGFVARGGFSLARAGGAGVGYMPVPALLSLTDSARPSYVLVRNTTSYHYRFATLDVICPF